MCALCAIWHFSAFYGCFYANSMSVHVYTRFLASAGLPYRCHILALTRCKGTIRKPFWQTFVWKFHNEMYFYAEGYAHCKANHTQIGPKATPFASEAWFMYGRRNTYLLKHPPACNHTGPQCGTLTHDSCRKAMPSIRMADMALLATRHSCAQMRPHFEPPARDLTNSNILLCFHVNFVKKCQRNTKEYNEKPLQCRLYNSWEPTHLLGFSMG